MLHGGRLLLRCALVRAAAVPGGSACLAPGGATGGSDSRCWSAAAMGVPRQGGVCGGGGTVTRWGCCGVKRTWIVTRPSDGADPCPVSAETCPARWHARELRKGRCLHYRDVVPERPARLSSSGSAFAPGADPRSPSWMESGRHCVFPSRIWTVDVRASHPQTVAVCRICGPLKGAAAAPAASRADVLRHLALHARSDVTPTHLRTCQCRQHGCGWHRRQRDCAGVVLLALTHRAASRIWRLADVCRECCSVMPDTAAVPHWSTAETHTYCPNTSPQTPVPHDDAEYEQAQVWEDAESI